jgi:ubiquinone/menaquinone biosynthesis C-methylase UbiE
LLDIGANSGAFVQYVRNTLGNKQAYGVDNEELKIDPSDHEGMVAADGLSLPFPDNSFGIIFARNYFPMFVPNEDTMRQAITEALRVLQPGGKLLGNITTPEHESASAEYWVQRARPEAREQSQKNHDKRYAGAQKLETFLQELNEAGYSVRYDERTSAQHPRRTTVTIQKP